MIMATKGGFLGQLQRIAECRLRKVGSNMVSQLNLQKHYVPNLSLGEHACIYRLT